ncbi:hypothetical protein D6D27_02225 [Aureobasidium pullulans]|nr:hypothetical protein D6D27_02225 [Aureobasidium pullulans]
MSASPDNAANGANASSVNEARDPSGFLSQIIGAPVTVKLNSGVVYRGVLRLSARRHGDPEEREREREDMNTDAVLKQANCNQSMDT